MKIGITMFAIGAAVAVNAAGGIFSYVNSLPPVAHKPQLTLAAALAPSNKTAMTAAQQAALASRAWRLKETKDASKEATPETILTTAQDGVEIDELLKALIDLPASSVFLPPQQMREAAQRMECDYELDPSRFMLVTCD